MIPRVLLQAVHWCDVVAWYPALPILRTYLTPFTILVVTQDSQLLTYEPGGKKAKEAQYDLLGLIKRHSPPAD